jgi:hypothetical protein
MQTICHSCGCDTLNLSSYNTYQKLVLLFYQLSNAVGEDPDYTVPDVSSITSDFSAMMAIIPFIIGIVTAVGAY